MKFFRSPKILLIAGIVGLAGFGLILIQFNSGGASDPSDAQQGDMVQPLRINRPTGPQSRPPGNPRHNLEITRTLDITKPAAFNSNGRLTTTAAELAGLTKTEIAEVNELLGEMNSTMEAELSNSATYNKRESDPDKHIIVYDIPAMDDRGKSILDNFRSRLTERIGNEKAREIYDLFETGPSINSLYGGYGKYDVNLRFHPAESSQSSELIASFTYLDPSTGDWISKSEMEIREFRAQFGDTFKFENVESPGEPP